MTVTVVDNGPRKVTRSVEVDRPAGELFALVADPHRHRELDGSGTVQDTVTGPHELHEGDKFSVKMKMYGLPYRITSRVTELVADRVVEWQHPGGHRWRWEFTPVGEGRTTVSETFDYSTVPGVQAKALEVFGFPRKNAAGIEATLKKLSVG
jgi:uncharacterized protein YndB with AHSA1/START domain